MKFLEQIEEERYASFVENHPTKSHFLASPFWAEVSRLRGLVPSYVGVEEDGKLIATALLLKKSLPLGYCYFYIPRGFVMNYEREDCLAFLTESLKKYVRKQKGLYFKIDPDIRLHTIDDDACRIEGEDHYHLVEVLKELGYRRKPLTKYFETSQPRYTFRVNLEDDMDTIRKRYSKTALRFIKKAEHYKVEPFVGTKEEVKEFVRLMKMTEQRQNFFSHDASFYEKFYDTFSSAHHVSLLLAKVNLEEMIKVVQEDIVKEEKKENQNEVFLKNKREELAFFEKEAKTKKEAVVSGYFTVHYGDKSWYLYGANDLNYKMTYANYKLFDFQIQTAKDYGSTWFDEFGTIGEPQSTNPLVGLHEFKKKFGGEYLEFIGEFDYITRPIVAFFFLKFVPIYRKIVKKRLRKQVKKDASRSR